VVFKVVTSHQPAWLQNYQNEVEVVVDATTPFYQLASQADVLVNPVEIKGGTRIKLLEALAAGLPVATFCSSLVGFSKLEAGRDLLAADEPEAFAQATTQLLKNADLRDKIRENGRRVVQENYSWEKSLAELLEIYAGLSHYDEKS
jgi:glycosyltransferase involved in cell wall biosynthesis